MKVVYSRSFPRDLKRIRDRSLRLRVDNVIAQVKNAQGVDQIPNILQMTGQSNFYRIRVGDYRVGVKIIGDEVEFTRFLHRREIYRSFP